MSTVREAMVSNPGQLPATASAQAAGELLQRPEVRAVYVTEDERLVGVVTRKTLVREVIALGLDPTETELRSIAEPPHFSIGPDVPLEEAFRFLEFMNLGNAAPGRPLVERYGQMSMLESYRHALDAAGLEFQSDPFACGLHLRSRLD